MTYGLDQTSHMRNDKAAVCAKQEERLHGEAFHMMIVDI